MKKLLVILYATTAFSAVIPMYPEFADSPDSAQVKSSKTNEINYTVKYSYNNDGYLVSEKYFEKGLQTGYVECHFQKSGDTVKCTYTITDEPDNKYLDLYIFDNNRRIVRYKGYDDTYLYDDETIVYNQENKISKTITATPSLAAEIGDSVVYRYQNGRITTVDVYGDRGSKWSYSAYETNSSGKVNRSTEYSCENSCVADTEYMVYYYGNSPVRHEIRKKSVTDIYQISLSNNCLLVSMHNNNAKIYNVSIFDLNGKCIQKVSAVEQNHLLLPSQAVTGRSVILQLQTSEGNCNVKISKLGSDLF